MHDPSTVAFEIYYPWQKRFWQTENQYLKEYQNKKTIKYYSPFITIWHEDPETDGTDDSCGYSYPKIPKNLKEEVEKIAHSECSDYGLFPNSKPKQESITTILASFYVISWRIFRKEISPKNLVDIIDVCVNPVDNLRHCTDTKNEEDVKRFFYLCLRFYLKINRPWWKHPKWHIHHWKLQIHPLERIKRYLFSRCGFCKKGFAWNESVMGSWDGASIFHHHCYSKECYVPIDQQKKQQFGNKNEKNNDL